MQRLHILTSDMVNFIPQTPYFPPQKRSKIVHANDASFQLKSIQPQTHVCLPRQKQPQEAEQRKQMQVLLETSQAQS